MKEKCGLCTQCFANSDFIACFKCICENVLFLYHSVILLSNSELFVVNGAI